MALDAKTMDKIRKSSIAGEMFNMVIFTIFMYFSGLFDIYQYHMLKLSVFAGFLYLFISGFTRYVLIEIEIFKAKTAQKADQQ